MKEENKSDFPHIISGFDGNVHSDKFAGKKKEYNHQPKGLYE